MHILVFRTSIATKKAVAATASFFNEHPDIMDWSIDLEDWENILRIESKDDIDVENLIQHIYTLGYSCEELED
ncbi:MAG: hypothetical protein WBG46_12710 [Nonlabens sp.]